jgi:hypothetical protein
MFTDDDDTSHVRDVLAAGVSAYVVAGLAPDRIRPVLEVALARLQHEHNFVANWPMRAPSQERKVIERGRWGDRRASGRLHRQRRRALRFTASRIEVRNQLRLLRAGTATNRERLDRRRRDRCMTMTAVSQTIGATALLMRGTEGELRSLEPVSAKPASVRFRAPNLTG